MSEFVSRTIESSGKSIDEAIFRGMMELGVSIDEVTIETIQEGTKGLLGIGSKPFKVRLTTKPLDLTALEEKKQPKKRSRKNDRKKPEAQDNQPAEGVAEAAEAQEAPQPRQKKRSDRRRGERKERVIPEDTTPYVPYVPGESQCPGADFLLGVLRRMGVTCGIGYCDQPEALRFRIDSDTMGILIGHRGETLDSLQYLTGLVVNKDRNEYRRVVLDTENYRNKREDTLVRLARKLAAQVQETGQSVTLEPMNPYERRVLHATLQNSRYVTTRSEGEDPNRWVIIEPKNQETEE